MPASSDSSAAAGNGGQAPVRKKALWKKITCGVAPILCTGLLVMMAIFVFLTLFRVPDYEVPNNAPYLKLVCVSDWLENSKEAMIDLETDNLAQLTSERVQYVGEIYGRVQEDVLKLQAIAGQVLLQTPRDIIVERYVKRNAGLEQAYLTWNHSVWYIPDFDVGEVPTWNSSLQGLLKRSSLLEPTFRSMNKQHISTYVAGLENHGADLGLVSQINMQTYPALNMELAGYPDFSEANDCDDRFTQYGGSYVPSGYEPRCRVWYQDAVEGENEDAVFTKPYWDATSGKQVVTVAAPVFSGGDSELLGVAAIDIEYTGIEQVVEAYKIVEDEGYTYLLASGGSGEVLAHVNHSSWTTEYIADIEAGVDRTVFGALVTRMSTESSGNEFYSKAGKTWLLSWKHMKTRIPSVTGEQSPDDPSEGVIAVSTVSETAFLQYFNEMEKDIRNQVIVAIIIFSVLIVTVGVIIGCLARSLASRMTQPLAKLVDVVKALKRKDSPPTNQRSWLMEGLPSPELEDLVRSFENMTTVVKFSTTSLRNGDLEAAQKKYMDALVLFEKLGNARGVSIVYNNLGNIYTIQAKDLAKKAAASKNKVQAGKLLEQADANFKEAVTSFTIAIEDAEALYSRNKRRDSIGHSGARPSTGGKGEEHEKDKQEWKEEAQPTPALKKRGSFKTLSVFSSRKSDANADANSQDKEPAMDNQEKWAIIKGALNMNAADNKKEGITAKAEANRISPRGKKKSLLPVADNVDEADDDIEAPKLDRRPLSQRMSAWFRWGGPHPEDEDDYSSSLTLALQLFNRKFNLALCLAAKGTSAVSTGGLAEAEVIDEARKLLWDCAELAAGMRDAKGDQRHVECLLELATLECDILGREKEAGEALDAAERVIIAHRGARRRSLGKIYTRKGDIREESVEGTGISAPLSVLRQQLLTARGAHCLTVGDPDAAITRWTDAILDCGERMDVNAVLSSLQGLRELAVKGLGGRFPPHFLSALGIPKGTSVRASKNQKLIIALDVAMAKVDSKAAKYTRISEGVLGAKTTDVDLCFIMDCTQSMQTWIDQFNKKILPTIEQAKSEVLNINLRVGFVGYRDFGDKVQYEGPFNFHSEEDLPRLVKKLEDIKADGGKDIPDDLAGGLNLTLNLSWKSPIRIMMVITDAPCHGSMYHDFYDNYPKGCPKKLDPSKLVYTLQYQLGVDIYFVRISTHTDKMIGILENKLSVFTENRKNRALPALRGSDNTEPKFLVHDLGVNKLRFSEAVVQSIKVSAGISQGAGTF